LAVARNETIALSYQKLMIASISHAFTLLGLAESHVDDGAKNCLDQFQAIYNRICHHLSLDTPLSHHSLTSTKLKIVVSHTEDLLMAEVIPPPPPLHSYVLS
jgi:hypothetical protein